VPLGTWRETSTRFALTAGASSIAFSSPPQGKNTQVLLSGGLQEEDPEDACGNDSSGEAPAEGLGAPWRATQPEQSSYLSLEMLI